MIWDTKKVVMVGAVVVALTQLGTAVKWVARSLNTPDIADAALKKAEEVDTKFQKYLDHQDAYAEALNKYLANQQQQVPNQVPPQHRWWAQDDQDRWWFCDDPVYEQCWTNSAWHSE